VLQPGCPRLAIRNTSPAFDLLVRLGHSRGEAVPAGGRRPLAGLLTTFAEVDDDVAVIALTAGEETPRAVCTQ
jgi:hypothetical protein